LPYAFTLVGQYIMKNIIIVCAAIVVNIHSNSSQSEADEVYGRVGKGQ
jgi:hypothetical protein